VRASDQIIYASGVEAARPQLARHRLATSFLDDQDERIDVSRMLHMAAMRAVMRRFGKLAPPAVSVSTPPGFSPAAFEAMRRHAGAHLLSWMARVNERGMFEKPRGIAVSIRCCEREGRRRDYEDR
jgi:hypothetical protein